MVILVVFIIAASLFPSSWTLSDSFHLFLDGAVGCDCCIEISPLFHHYLHHHPQLFASSKYFSLSCPLSHLLHNLLFPQHFFYLSLHLFLTLLSSHHPICIPRKVLMRVGWMPKDSHTHKHTSVDTYLLWQDLPSGVLLNLQWLKIEQRASVSFWQIKKKWRTDREEERERETRQEREWEV